MARDPRLALLPRRSKRPRLGRRPKPSDRRDLHLARYLVARSLPPLPSSRDNGRKVPTFGMLLNDSLGICGEAGWLHGGQVWAYNAGRSYLPTDPQALDLYEIVGGYKPGDPSTDNGTVLRELLGYVRTHPVEGLHRIDAYAAVDPKNHDLIKQTIELFGFAYVGVAMTRDNYEKQGVRWTRTLGAGGQPDPDLGHCVIYTGWTKRGFKLVSWGQRGSVSYACHDLICDEAWASVSVDALDASGRSPELLDWAALRADLAQVTAA